MQGLKIIRIRLDRVQGKNILNNYYAKKKNVRVCVREREREREREG